MDDVMKALMAKAYENIAEAKKEEEKKHQVDAKKVEAVEHHTDAKKVEVKAEENEHHYDARKIETKVEENEHHDDAKKVETKAAETVHVIQPNSEAVAVQERPKKVEQPTWSAETQETSILPAMLEPQTPEPVKENEHHNDANLENRVMEQKTDNAPATEIEVVQPKVDTGIKLFVGMGGSFFLVALAAAVYTALKVTGVM